MTGCWGMVDDRMQQASLQVESAEIGLSCDVYTCYDEIKMALESDNLPEDARKELSTLSDVFEQEVPSLRFSGIIFMMITVTMRLL
eukprot:3771498-Karenia_brevis.AAC.1